jgi:hypothetical protein
MPTTERIPSYYRDRGCALASSCEQCPFPDDCHWTPSCEQGRRAARDVGIRAGHQLGRSVAELAIQYHLTEWSVRRIIRIGQKAVGD